MYFIEETALTNISPFDKSTDLLSDDNSIKTDKPIKAVLLLSGGLDSATTGAIARAEGRELYALSVNYGQRHRFELESADKVAASLKVAEHRILSIDLAQFGGSALTDDIEVPQSRSDEEIGTGIPITYVPARNTVMLSLALAYAEVVGAKEIMVGVNAVDYSGYPDCRPEFVSAFEKLANLATSVGVEAQAAGEGPAIRIVAPLLNLTKAQIVQRGTELGVDYALTHTCYAPNEAGISCGTCDACHLRKQGFSDAGLVDPIAYQ